MRPRVLLDSDGVVSDWIGGVLDVVREISGRIHYHDEVTTWLKLHQLGLTATQQKELEERIAEPGFCESLEELPGAREGVRRLREHADVHFVTSPWVSCPTWTFERTAWLQRHGYITDFKEVTHTYAKELVRGDFLVDDKPENVKKWSAANPDGQGFIWTQPWNRYADGYKIGSWDNLIGYVRWRMKR